MNFDKLMSQASKTSIGAWNFEDPDMSILTVTEENFEEHLVKQPAAIAYFGFLMKEAAREYEQLNKAFEYRYSEMYGDCANVLSKGKDKMTIKSVEAMILSKYQTELEDWNKRLAVKREKKDNFEIFYESWKQKGYTLNNFKDLVVAGLISLPTSITDGNGGSGFSPSFGRKKPIIPDSFNQ